MPPRHIPRPTSLRALHCVPSGVVVRAWLPEPCPAATGGSGFTIETGSESAIGINLPAFMQQVTNTHVKRWKEHRHEIGYGHLYQGRYKCFPVETEGYFYQVVRYLERNALRANLVERAESWRWSSLRRVEREDPAFPIVSTWPLPRPTDWLQIVNQPQTEAEVAALRCCVNRGRPFGDPNWGHGQAIGARMDDSAPWKTEETIIGLSQLSVLSIFSRFGGCHLLSPRQAMYEFRHPYRD